MKKLSLTINSFLMGLLMFLSFGMGIFTLARTDNPAPQAEAASQEFEEINSVYSYTEQDIPYALFTQTKVDGTNKYRKYEPENEYLLLTSDPADSTLYNSSIYVRFNIKRDGGESATRVPAAGLTVNAWLGDRPINVNKISTDPTNGYVNFAISYRETSVMYYADDHTPVDPADRSGFYQFEFIYRYTSLDGVTSDELYTITMSFTLVNKVDYLSGETAYNIVGAAQGDNATIRGESHDTYMYNYTYDVDGNIVYPKVAYEAHKFALNYTHTIGTSSYNYRYSNFMPNCLVSEIEDPSYDITIPTGYVAISKIGTSQTKRYNTYKKIITTEEDPDGPGGEDPIITTVIKPYYVEIPLAELGEYKFSVDILVEQSMGTVATYAVAEIPDLENSEVKYLTNFGFEITYKDQAANTYKQLRNAFTHADVLAANDRATNASYHVPDAIPLTDQAPIKFNYYSTAFDKDNSYYKNFNSLDNAKTALADLLTPPAEGSMYDKILSDTTLDTTFFETSKFDKEGVYIIKVAYSVTTSFDHIYRGVQLFYFEINNSAPALTAEYDTDGKENYAPLNTKYTNKNVRFKIESDENSFNAPITVKYTRYAAFNSVVTGTGTYVSNDLGGNFHSYTLEGSNYSIPNSMNGRFVIVVTYSPSRLNQYYEYIVDTSAIKEITITKVTHETDGGDYYIANNETIAQREYEEGVYDISLTNSAFTLSWKEKDWAQYAPNGITTKVTAYQLLLNDNSTEIAYYQTYDKTLTNGYSTDSAAPLNYQNSYKHLKPELRPLESNEYQTADGIYYYFVEDLAGNTFERIVMIDTSSPTFIQESQTFNEDGDTVYVNSYDMVANKANFVRTNTRLTFGKYKGIVYNYKDDSDENKLFNEKLLKTSLFKQYGPSNYFINIPINQVMYSKDDDGSRIEGAITNPDEFSVIELTTNGSGLFAGEGYFEFTSTAANGTEVYMYIEMNFDGAMGQYYLVGDDTGSTEERYIASNNGTNLHKLFFMFKQGTEKTRVVKLTYSYYRYDYFSGGPSFPFSTEAEINQENLRIPEDDEADLNGMLRTEFINVQNGKTVAGKYVITRYYYGGGYNLVNGIPEKADYGKYDASGSEIDFGQDSFTRSYTIYIDHNGIISTTEQSGMKEVGENISITIGKGTPNEYVFKNFYRNVSAGSPILTTNKLPVQINIPVSKYFIDNGSANSNVASRLYFTKLDVVITYKNTTLQYSPTIVHNITQSNLEGYFVIPTFTAEGTYTITISDRSGYNEGTTRNINPMVYTCTFVIRHTYPNGNVYLNDELLEPSELDDKTFATNTDKEQSVTFVWQDAADPYTASVVELNITAVDKDEYDRLLLSDYNMEEVRDGTYTFDYTTFNYIIDIKVELISEGTFENKLYRQYKYTIRLNIEEEIDYRLEIRYAPTEELNHGYGEYVSTSYRVKIDRTKPNNNIDNLISTDKFLISNGYYNSIEDVVENFKDEKAIYNSTTPTIYDYAFAVEASNYKLIYDGEDTIPSFYFRKYAKFTTENQSLTPDHKDYANLSNFSNFPRFNITESNADYVLARYSSEDTLASLITKTSGIDTAGLAGSFYEVIERDLAGNYRVFTVYFSPTSIYNLLNVVASFKDEGNNDVIIDTNAQETTTINDLTIQNIYSTTGWGKLTVNNVTEVGKTPITYDITPYLSTSAIYNMSNEISNYIVTTKNARISFTLRNPAGTSSKYLNIVKSTSKLPIPDVIKTDSGKYIMVFPKKTATSVIYLTALKVKKGNAFIIDASGTNIPGESEELDVGLYTITYTDNTGGTPYSYQLHLGIDYVSSEDQFVYATNSKFIDTDGTIYTGGNVFITFQSKAHTVFIKNITESLDASETEINAEKYGPEYETNLVNFGGVDYIKINNDVYLRKIDHAAADNGFRTIMITEQSLDNGVGSEVIGGTKKYEINYKYRNYQEPGAADSGSINTYNIVIYNKLAGIQLYDKNQNPIAGSTSSGSMALTSSSVKINWETLLDAPLSHLYSAVVVLNSLTESGEIISSIEISNNRVISTPGYYAVSLSNSAFGNHREVYFAIQDGEIPFYTVIDKTNGATLTASPETLDIINNSDTVDGSSLKTKIENHIKAVYGEGEQANALLKKLTDSPTTVEQYFSLNDCDIRLDASSELYYEKIYFKNGSYIRDLSSGVSKSDFLTTFYLIYGNNNPIYANLIAVTKVPKSETNIVANKLYYIYTGAAEISNELTGISKTIKNNELDNNSVNVYWSAVSKDDIRWFNRGNLVYLNYTFNNVTSIRNFGTTGYSATVATEGPLSKITLSGSGKHQLTFMDLAGNVSFFRASSSGYSQPYYQLTILDKVIYNIDNATPLDYAVYNSAITLNIDTSYSADYNINSLTVTVLRNGSYYENYIRDSEGTAFTFFESGRYIVTLNATYNDTTSLNTATYNFTILDRSSARLAYEFNEMLGYEITRVYKNNADITDRIKDYYIKANKLPVTIEEYKLTELFISPDRFGNGDYLVSVSVKYNDLLAAKTFTFGFKISDVTPIIMSSPEYGATTKGDIVLTFNPSYIYQQIGKSSIRVLTFNSDTNRFVELDRYEINEDSLLDPNVKTLKINTTNSYYFQLVTDSGNIITSFRINRAEPLNTLSIIIIVLASVTGVVVAILFIKMRTKMKVR